MFIPKLRWDKIKCALLKWLKFINGMPGELRGSNSRRAETLHAWTRTKLLSCWWDIRQECFSLRVHFSSKPGVSSDGANELHLATHRATTSSFAHSGGRPDMTPHTPRSQTNSFPAIPDHFKWLKTISVAIKTSLTVIYFSSERLSRHLFFFLWKWEKKFILG